MTNYLGWLKRGSELCLASGRESLGTGNAMRSRNVFAWGSWVVLCDL